METLVNCFGIEDTIRGLLNNLEELRAKVGFNPQRFRKVLRSLVENAKDKKWCSIQVQH